jgi:cytochrome P450
MESIKSIPSPKGHWFFGHISDFNEKARHKLNESRINEIGETFRIRLVHKPFIVTANQEIINQVLSLRPHAFRRFHKIDMVMTELGVDGVFNAEGTKWKRHRRAVAESLSFKKIHGFYPRIIDKSNRIIERWKVLENQGKNLDVLSEMRSYTLELTCSLIFGYEMDLIHGKADELQEHLDRILPMVNKRIGAAFPKWRYFPSDEDKAFIDSFKYLEKLVLDFIQDARQRLEHNPAIRSRPTNFLESLLVEQEVDRFTDKEIYGNIFTMLLAGEDTTANSLSWCLYFLAQYPEMVQRISEEVDGVFGKTSIEADPEKINSLKFTKACIEEASRLKPVAPILYFEALEQVFVGDFKINKGDSLMLQTAINQNRDINFSDASSFIPHRWLKGECPMGYKHSPDKVRTFGYGPRFCPGKNLAYSEMIVLLGNICRNFDLELTIPADEVEEVLAFTMHPSNLSIKLKNK